MIGHWKQIDTAMGPMWVEPGHEETAHAIASGTDPSGWPDAVGGGIPGETVVPCVRQDPLQPGLPAGFGL